MNAGRRTFRIAPLAGVIAACLPGLFAVGRLAFVPSAN